MSRPAITLEDLLVHYRGAYYTTVALEGRFAKLGRDQRPALEERSRYRAMAKRYWDALQATKALHEERRPG